MLFWYTTKTFLISTSLTTASLLGLELVPESWPLPYHIEVVSPICIFLSADIPRGFFSSSVVAMVLLTPVMFCPTIIYVLFVITMVSAQSQCYYAAGKVASSNLVPCKGFSDGHSSCCFLGDLCLSSNACYSETADTEYIAGCTDEKYEASTCGAQQCNKRMTFINQNKEVSED